MMRSRPNPLPVLPALRRPARGLAAVIALMMVASNACAAMGLCIAKSGAAAPAGVPELVVTRATVGDARGTDLAADAVAAHSASEDLPCPQHGNAAAPASGTADPALGAHCPQEDPGAQGRTADLPALDLLLAGAVARPPALPAAVGHAAFAGFDDLPLTPLYTRLARLLL
jgi:hypothetical protein